MKTAKFDQLSIHNLTISPSASTVLSAYCDCWVFGRIVSILALVPVQTAFETSQNGCVPDVW